MNTGSREWERGWLTERGLALRDESPAPEWHALTLSLIHI